MYELCITLLIAGHIFGDAMLQSREMGEGKSSNPWILFKHVCILSSVTFIISLLFLRPLQAIEFTFYNAVAHALIDGSIWNIYKFKARALARRKYDTEFDTGASYAKFEDYLQKEFIPNFQYWKDKDFYTFIITDQMLHVLCFIWFLKLVIG